MPTINLGDSFYLKSNVPWGKKKGFIIARRPKQSSPFLKAQQARFAQAAYNAYGTGGRMGVAAKVAQTLGRTAQVQTQVGIAGKRLTSEAASRALQARENKHRITGAKIGQASQMAV
jgi:hypothetical protein